jgi:hypothetical protein
MKLIMVKSDGPMPKLHLCSAVNFSATSQTLMVDREIPMKDGPTTFVHISACYEYDCDTIDAVNGLMTSAQERISAALVLLTNELEPVKLTPAHGAAEFTEEVRH